MPKKRIVPIVLAVFGGVSGAVSSGNVFDMALGVGIWYVIGLGIMALFSRVRPSKGPSEPLS